jgi:hypothetical protein
VNFGQNGLIKSTPDDFNGAVKGMVMLHETYELFLDSAIEGQVSILWISSSAAKFSDNFFLPRFYF